MDSRMARPQTRPLRVDLEANEWDRLVRDLTEKGFFADTIRRKIGSGITIAQIRYRQRLLRVSALDYRRGEGKEASDVIKFVKEQIAALKLRHLSEVKRTMP